MRAAPARYLTVLRGATFFLSRGPPGGCPVCVLSVLEGMQWALAGPLFFRVRDAHFVLPLYMNTKHARFASGASRGNLAAPCPKGGKGTPTKKNFVFSFYETHTRFFLCLYLVPSQRRGAVFFPPPGLTRAFNTDSTKQFSSRRRLRRRKHVAREK